MAAFSVLDEGIRRLDMLPRPPGPKGHLLRGNLPEFIADQTGFLSRCARDYGDVVSLRFGPKRVLLVNNPALIERVLITERRAFGKPYILRTNRLRVEEPDDSEVAVWPRPQLARTAFHRKQIVTYGDTMVGLTEQMLTTWHDGQTYDVMSEMMGLTLAIIGQTLFGADLSQQARVVYTSLNTVMESFVRRMKYGFLIPEQIPTPGNRRLRHALRQLNALTDGIVEQWRTGQADGGALLSMLPHPDSAEGQKLNLQRVRDEITTFALAGHETIALTLSWAWHLLSQHPDVEAKLHAELQEVLGGRAPSAADQPSLRYTEMIILEAMRLYPPIWVMGRLALQDGQLGDYGLAKGTIVLLSQWVTHRDARFFEDPDTFNPDRWAYGLAQRLPRYAYYPFGGGPRGCIGSQFAMLEGVLLLATIAQRFRLTPLSGRPVVPEPSITLRPAHGLPMTVHRRQLPVSDTDGELPLVVASQYGSSTGSEDACPFATNAQS